MRTKAYLALFMLMLVRGSLSMAAGQTHDAGALPMLTATVASVPHRNIASVAFVFGLSYRPAKGKWSLFDHKPNTARSAFWSEDSVTLAELGQGRFAIDGCEREYNGRALLHPSSATPMRDALRLLQGTATLRNAPTSFSLRISWRLGRRS